MHRQGVPLGGRKANRQLAGCLLLHAIDALQSGAPGPWSASWARIHSRIVLAGTGTALARQMTGRTLQVIGPAPLGSARQADVRECLLRVRIRDPATRSGGACGTSREASFSCQIQRFPVAFGPCNRFHLRTEHAGRAVQDDSSRFSASIHASGAPLKHRDWACAKRQPGQFAAGFIDAARPKACAG